jgi:hypothetical protein
MENNGVFAHVNDSIRRLAADGPASQTWEFICECPELTCHTLVSLTLTDFDERRSATPRLPILATEHGDVDRGLASSSR